MTFSPGQIKTSRSLESNVTKQNCQQNCPSTHKSIKHDPRDKEIFLFLPENTESFHTIISFCLIFFRQSVQLTFIKKIYMWFNIWTGQKIWSDHKSSNVKHWLCLIVSKELKWILLTGSGWQVWFSSSPKIFITCFLFSMSTQITIICD